jgi:hypothetical protein
MKLTPTKLNRLLTKCYSANRLTVNEWQLNTIGGPLFIKFIDNDFVHMSFLDIQTANANIKDTARLNPYSGKFNFHWLKKEKIDVKIAELTSVLTNIVI